MLALLAAVTALSVVQNGDFARGTLRGSWTPLETGSTAIAQWRVVAGRVDYIGSLFAPPAPGLRSVDLDGTPGAGAIAQTLRTAPGVRYRVAFSVAPNPEGPPAVKRLRVSAGADAAEFDVPTPPGATRSSMAWSRRTFDFVARSASTELTFASLDPGRYAWNGPLVAQISVVAGGTESSPPTPVPERSAPPPPAPSATPHTAAPVPAPAPSRSASADEGTWLGAYPLHPVHLRVDAKGTRLVATVLDASLAFPADTIAFAVDHRGASYVGLARCPGNGPNWHGATALRHGSDQLVLTIADCPHGTVQIDRVR